MKKRVTYFFLVLVMCICTNIYAQENAGIKFVEGKTFAEALAQAKQENKMLFIDCYTTWCGPCKMLSKDIFPQKAVGDFFNPKFVCIKVDMEKGEGVELRKKFEVRAFPTMLFLDSDGQVINRIVGASNAEELLKKAEIGMTEKGLVSMQKKYNAGERSEQFMFDYIDVLSGAYMQKECEKVAIELLTGRESQVIDNKKFYAIFCQYVSSPDNSTVQYLLDHKADFAKTEAATGLNRKLDLIWSGYPKSFIIKENNTATLDEAKMKDYVELMKKYKVADRQKIADMTYINLAEAQGDWVKLATLFDKYQKSYGAVEDYYIYNWSNRIEKNCKDVKTRTMAASWLEKRLKAYKKEVAKEKPLPAGQMKAMRMVDPSVLYPALIEKLKTI